MPNSLASTLLAIGQRRGALFMLDSSRWLIETWNLESDRLQEQSEDTIRLVQRLLKSGSSWEDPGQDADIQKRPTRGRPVPATVQRPA